MLRHMTPSREQLLHALYEAAELEHNLMCTYLYAAFSLNTETQARPEELDAVRRWRSEIIAVATEEMAHLAAIWNITSALGGTPQFGRTNFPLEAGRLPASIVVKLAAFSDDVLQHFIFLERPETSSETDGSGFIAQSYTRKTQGERITPMAVDYETVGAFYAKLQSDLRQFADVHGKDAFCGDAELQLTTADVALPDLTAVKCLDTALSALASIVEQGEGAAAHTAASHFARFTHMRTELSALQGENPDFRPAYPAATNPVLRAPVYREGRVWIENEEAALYVDVANTSYALMLRLLAYAYTVPRAATERGLAIDLSIGLMHVVSIAGEGAARLPAGPSNPECNAGMSFAVLRTAAPLMPGPASRRLLTERLGELSEYAKRLGDKPRAAQIAKTLAGLHARAVRGFETVGHLPIVAHQASAPPSYAEPRTVANGVERIEGERLTLIFEEKKCIHSRQCVTGAPTVFLANVKGPWIHPDAIDAELLAGIAHVCPSGAIRYQRKDGRPDEEPSAVNLVAVREGGPYAVRGAIELDGAPIGNRATLCRCGASKNKPFCDGSHHEISFAASGEPATDSKRSEMLATRNGPLAISPAVDGPYEVRGNLEIVSGTGRMVARMTTVRLCRCGGSSTKPYCDGTHARNGFKS
jgi:CDGSH-type Zn-finger protein/uncharacterized Fe-S cluster protein YjdI